MAGCMKIMTRKIVTIYIMNEVKTTEKIQITCISIEEGQNTAQGLKHIFKTEGEQNLEMTDNSMELR